MADQTEVAVVTGAARGIGRASAISLARKGFALAVADRLEDEMEGTAAEIKAPTYRHAAYSVMPW